jgi:hypothetical protein
LIFDIPVKQASHIEFIFNPRIKQSMKQLEPFKGFNESQLPALSESKVSQFSSLMKPSSKIGPISSKPTNSMYNSIDATELLLAMIL